MISDPTLNPSPAYLPADSASFVAGDGAGTVTSAPITIWNREAVGVLVDKINVYASMAALIDGTQANTAILAQLRLGNEPLTNGYVPLGGVSWPANRSMERSAVSTIKLPKPLWLEPGGFISASFRNDLVPSRAVTLTASAIGVQAAAPPKERWIPYLAAYMTDAYANAGATIDATSSPLDLGNPFDTPLVIERLIGRVLSRTAPEPFRDQDPSGAWYAFLVRMVDHANNAWIETPTPIPLAFDAITRSWPVNYTLPAKGYATAEFSGTATYAGDGAGVIARGLVGFIASRRIG